MKGDYIIRLHKHTHVLVNIHSPLLSITCRGGKLITPIGCVSLVLHVWPPLGQGDHSKDDERN